MWLLYHGLYGWVKKPCRCVIYDYVVSKDMLFVNTCYAMWLSYRWHRPNFYDSCIRLYCFYRTYYFDCYITHRLTLCHWIFFIKITRATRWRVPCKWRQICWNSLVNICSFDHEIASQGRILEMVRFWWQISTSINSYLTYLRSLHC